MTDYSPSIAPLVLVVGLALVFGFSNGMSDSAGLVATVISSGALSPRKALLMVAVAELIGPFLLGTAVATSIGKGIVEPDAISVDVIIVALGIAIGWNLLALRLGMPSSSSHALVGGIVGATLASGNWQILQLGGLLKVVGALLLAPILGGLVGYLAMVAVLFLCHAATPRVNLLFKRSQIATSILLALSHGANDAQKTMGVITMTLVAQGALRSFEVPIWVIAAAAASISLGIAVGGWRTIRTLGGKIYRIRPIHGFTVQSTAASILLAVALVGGPVSTTQVVGSSILGVGAAERVSKVRWGIASRIVATWLTTIPATATLAAAFRTALLATTR